ncbi:MAG: hypothetical protein RIF41_40820 [Polyangiaceae bacterium]
MLLDAPCPAWFSVTVGKRRRDTTTTVLMAIAAVVWVVAGIFAVRGRPDDDGSSSASAATSEPTATTPAPTASATAKTSAAPTTTASAPPPESKNPTACIGEALSTEEVDYAFVCRQTNPLKASGKIKSALVRDGKGLVTDAMRQWAGLGWYEMAAFAILRASCCPAGEPLAYNFVLACPLDEAINELDAAVRTGKREAIDAAIKRYSKEARCLDQFGQARNMGRDGPPGSGIAALRRLVDAMFGK